MKDALKNQYRAALQTLRHTIEKCPDAMWNDPADGLTAFWRVAYHALFFTDFYSQDSVEAFKPWSRHREEANCLGPVPWENNRAPKPCEPYTRQDMLEYLGYCNDVIDARIDSMDFSAVTCGFPWYRMGKLEHQLVNLRHLQHHAAALSARLRLKAGIAIPWVGGVENALQRSTPSS